MVCEREFNMKKITLSMTDAFRLRNLMKGKIREVSYELKTVPVSFETAVGSHEADEVSRKYGGAFGCAKFLLALQGALGELNVAIDGANSAIRPLIDRAETLGENIASLTELVAQIRRNVQKVKREFNSVTGNNDIIEMSQSYADGDIAALEELLKASRREKLEAERRVMKMNGETFFDFEVDEKIHDFVYEL